MVCTGISLSDHTDLHVLHGGTLTCVRYRDDVLYSYARPYVRAFANDFIAVDDNARTY